MNSLSEELKFTLTRQIGRLPQKCNFVIEVLFQRVQWTLFYQSLWTNKSPVSRVTASHWETSGVPESIRALTIFSELKNLWSCPGSNPGPGSLCGRPVLYPLRYAQRSAVSSWANVLFSLHDLKNAISWLKYFFKESCEHCSIRTYRNYGQAHC